MIDLQLEPSETTNKETSLPPLRCSMLRTSGRLKIVSIKKYLVQKLGLKDTQSSVSQHEVYFEKYGALCFATSLNIVLPFSCRLTYSAMETRWEMSIILPSFYVLVGSHQIKC